jgi:hypothetical protein
MKKSFVAGLLVISLAAMGQELPKSELSVSLGYLMEGEVYVWTPNVYGSVGETVLFKADYTGYFSDYFGVGGYVSYANPYYWAFGNVSMYEVGFLLKGRFKAGEKMLIKLPVYVGYRGYGNEAGQALAINVSGVFEYQSEKVKPFLDIGFLSQPTGGNDATSMTFSPTFQVSAGITLHLTKP